MKYILLIFLLHFVLCTELFSNSNYNVPKGFIENKGQLRNQYGIKNKEVLYLLTTKGLSVQLRKNGLSYEIFGSRGLNRIDIDFDGIQKNVTLNAIEQQEGELRFIDKFNPSNSYITHAYRRVVYTNLYPGIDLECLVNKDRGGFKYNFIIHPGANPSSIKLRINGAKACHVNELGNLCLGIGKEILKEEIPESYTLNSNGSKANEVKVNYQLLSKNVIGYNVMEYDSSKVLVIDPVVWITYYGGDGADIINGVVTDADSNMYLVGTTSSSSGIASTGAHQSSFSGSQDIFVAKFNKVGQLVWGTYYGGIGNDIGLDIKMISPNKLVLVGSTISQTGISSSGAFQVAIGGQTDGFISSFDTSGSFLWGSYFGGNQNDYISSIVIDPITSQLSVAGYTSSANLPIVNSSSHQNIAAGFTDYFLARFTINMQPLWATYFGGTQTESICTITTDVSGKIYLVGNSTSESGLTTSNAWKQFNYSGGQDGVLGIFDSLGNLRYGTFFGMSNKLDGFEDIITDGSGKLFVTGSFESKDSIATVGAFKFSRDTSSTKLEGGIICFDTSGTRLWGTYFGGESNDYIKDIALSKDGYVFITGYTHSATGISYPNSLQPAMGDVVDGFYSIFTKDGNHLSGSYFGGNNSDIIWQIFPWSIDEFILFGQSWSDSFVAAPGGYIVPKPSTGYDAFIARIGPDKTVSQPCNFTAGFSVNQLIQCERGNEFVFTDTTTASGVTRLWDFGNGNSGLNQEERVSYIFGPQNYFDVRLTLSAGTCESIATQRVYLIANPDAKAITGTDVVKRLELVTYNVPFTNGSTYEWFYENGIGSSRSNTINIRWTSKGTTTLKVVETNNGPCVGDTISLPITIDAAVGEKEISYEFKLRLYPNPVQEEISLMGIVSGNLPYIIIDAFGSEILSGNYNIGESINIAELHIGYYLLLIKLENGAQQVYPFIKLDNY